MEHYRRLPTNLSILEIADARPLQSDSEIAAYVSAVLERGLHLPESGPGHERHARFLEAIAACRPDLYQPSA